MINNTILKTLYITLLKRIMYKDDNPKLWHNLLLERNAVNEYFRMLNLEVFIDENDGYAFLRQINLEEIVDVNDSIAVDDIDKVPQLINRRPLTFSVSLLCVLLRQKILYHDSMSSEVRLIMSRDNIIDTMLPYLPDNTNQVKVVDQIKTSINKLLELGFLAKLKDNEDKFEVRTIIKAFIDAKWLNELDTRLGEYKDYAHAKTTE